VSSHRSNKSLIKQILSTTAISLSLGFMAFSSAHAEQYCKSVDKDGNATYTLAPDKGCNTKKMKTVAISHHITPNAPAPKPEVASQAAAAPSTTPTTPSAAPAPTATPSAAPPIQPATVTATNTPQQTPNR